jgi:subtilisin family serine protease
MNLSFRPALIVTIEILFLGAGALAAQRVSNTNDANSNVPVAIQLPADSPSSSHPVERVVATSTILDERVESLPDGAVKRTRLLRSDIQAHLLRVEEVWSAGSSTNSWICRRRDMFLADELIINVRAGTSRERLRALLAQLEIDLDSFVATNIFTARLREANLDSIPRALTAVAANPTVIEFAEPDGVGFGGGVPNDPLFSQQWGEYNVGQGGGIVGADVSGPDLWDILGAAPGVTVAVLDSGLNFTHPDLQGIAWTNSAEIAGDGIDNDGDGFIDDVNGWDFTNGDNNPTDDHGHGSNVSGIIAANRDNGIGVAGMLGGVRILVCKILNASNAGTTSALIAGTTYARQRGVPIMNMSLQNYPFSSTLNNEFNACQAAGILLCICAGNQGVNNDTTPNYPSCYPQANIIAVGNHDRTDVRWAGSFNPSNFGANTVDLFAPGENILSPVLGTSYAYYTGTSQATPFVTAVAAALKYLNPDWTAPDIKNCILQSVIQRPAYNGICLTGGRLNAVTTVANAVRARPTADRDGDSVPNFIEYLAGTRIDSPSSRPALSDTLVSGFLHLKMPRVLRPDGHLEIQWSSNLVDWTATGVTDFSTSGLLDGAIPAANSPAGFLRVVGVVDP